MTRAGILTALAATGLAGWLIVAAIGRGGSPWHEIIVIAGASLAFTAGRLSGRWAGHVGAAVAVAAAALAATPGALSGHPLAPPLGYGNADGALYAAGVAGASLAVVTGRRLAVTAPAAVLAVVLAVATALTRSVAALGTSVLVVAACVAALATGLTARAAAAAAASIVLAAIAVTVGAGVLSRPAPPQPRAVRVVAGALTERRVDLWHDAIRLGEEHPLLGVGPGNFPVTSAVARRDPDTRWAHSLPLETVAEDGVPAVVLLALAGAGALAIGSRSGRPYEPRRRIAPAGGRASIVGLGALAGIGAQNAIDYVAHFWAVPVVSALVIGAAFATCSDVANQPNG